MELFTKIITAISIVLLFACEQKSNQTNHKKVEKLEEIDSQDFSVMGEFTGGIEGPAIDSEGNIYAVNYAKEGTIGKVNFEGKGEVFATLPEGSIGNSIRFDENEVMYIADYAGHVVYAYHNNVFDTVVHENKMNQPNDIALSESGNIYASDPNWSNNTGNLWLVKNGEAICLEDSMGTTNGIELNANQTKLFVNESVQRNVWVYDVLESGLVANKKLFYKFQDYGMDGMKYNPITDELFIARYGAGEIAVLNKEGKLDRTYKLKGTKPTNFVFSKTYDTLYVTMQERKGLEIIKF